MTTVPAPPGRARRVWGHTWRLLLGLVPTAVVVLAMYGIVLEEVPGAGEQLGPWLAFDLVATTVTCVLYVLRHRAPTVLTALVVTLGSFAPFACGLAALAMVSLATRRRWSQIVPVAVLWCVTSLLGGVVYERVLVDPGDLWRYQDLLTSVVVVASVALCVVTGMFIGGRRALVASLREQAAIARREADARGDSARAAERNRIAREMHDVLAHRLSLVALHSGALEYRAGLDPDQVRSTAAVVRENAHEALGELREVLGLLRDTTHGEDLSRPQPTFAQVDELVEAARTAGSPVRFTLAGVTADDVDRLPVSTSRHLYRVIQECLTNARKHAPGQPVHVRVEGAPGERVTLEVTNPTGAGTSSLPSSGWGLTGVSERLHLAGGGLDAGRRPDGTFAVHAWLPWGAGEAAPATADAQVVAPPV